MIKIGITGQSGFVGTHLFNQLSSQLDKFECIPFEDAFFEDDNKLRAFVKQCDVVVHLAAMMRSKTPNEVYEVNKRLTEQLISAMEVENVSPTILFASSILEGNGSEYGRSKEECRVRLSEWADSHKTGFMGMLFPNLFGSLARPNSHSFIATFCYKLTHNEEPQVFVDNTVPLKYIERILGELIEEMIVVYKHKSICTYRFTSDYHVKVTEVLAILNKLNKGGKAETQLEYDLEKTLQSYVNYKL